MNILWLLYLYHIYPDRSSSKSSLSCGWLVKGRLFVWLHSWTEPRKPTLVINVSRFHCVTLQIHTIPEMKPDICTQVECIRKAVYSMGYVSLLLHNFYFYLCCLQQTLSPWDTSNELPALKATNETQTS